LDIQSKEIEKERIRQEIIALKNKLKISKDKEKDIIEAMKEVKDRISKIEEEQRKALREGKSDDAIAMLLYSNEIQNNLRYYN
ncbi:hypothetical protein NLD30_12090, partial [SCandidatus Aminicenantes bacterium Aminicenantia_JdfR_composite]|nr:hypothetical protein [SCandidatus Aminicenantes bacterium Aminicenantia_JdfR_composite]